MAIITEDTKGKIRDRPIAPELKEVLLRAAEVAGIETVRVTSGGQPGSSGRSTGSTRHDYGRAADLQLQKGGHSLDFTNLDDRRIVEEFVAAAAAYGANGIGAGVDYMGPKTLHVGFGTTPQDHSHIVWGAQGRSANAPAWLREAANRGWNGPQDFEHEHAFEPSEEGGYPVPSGEGGVRGAVRRGRAPGVKVSEATARTLRERTEGSPGRTRSNGVDICRGRRPGL